MSFKIIIVSVLILYIIYIILYRYKFPLFMSKDTEENFTNLLEQVDIILKKNNIQYFIICGTLLGSIRHGKIIPWDDDADIGILDNDMDKFNSIDFSKYGFKFIPASKDGCGKIFLSEKVFVDIFPFEKNNGIYQYLEKGARQKWPNEYFHEAELFPLKKYKFGRLCLSGPQKYLPYAERAWGNWKKPVFKFHKMIAYPLDMLKLYL